MLLPETRPGAPPPSTERESASYSRRNARHAPAPQGDRPMQRDLLAGLAFLSLTFAGPAAPQEDGPGAAPRSIEEGAQDFLASNPAPEEIAEEWLAWVNQTGTAVWDRPQLTRAQRSLITIAALSVLREGPPLRVHVEAGLANGLSRTQIAEAIMHTAVYAGVPQALRSMRIAHEVFLRIDERGNAAGSRSDEPPREDPMPDANHQ